MRENVCLEHTTLARKPDNVSKMKQMKPAFVPGKACPVSVWLSKGRKVVKAERGVRALP